MAINDDILKNYIGKVLELKNRKDITAEDLKKIALELGITRADLDDIDKAVHDHLVRGRNYLLHKCWDDAIAEFENALGLSPLDPEILYELANSHYLRAHGKKHKKDLEKAETLARECIQYAPEHKEAYALLQAINKPAINAGKGNGRILLSNIIAGITIIMFIVGFITYFLLTAGKKPEKVQAVTVNTSGIQETIPEEEPPAKPEVPAKDLHEKDEPVKRSLPVTLVKDEQSAYFKMTVRESVLNPYQNTFSWVFKADIMPVDSAIKELSFNAVLIDKAGVVRYTETGDVLMDYEPSVLPGNTLPANILMYIKQKDPGIARAEIKVSFIDQEPYTVTDAVFPAKQLSWAVPKPADITLAAVERQNSLSTSFNMSYHRLTFDITNNGSRSIELLKLRVDWFGKDGAALASNETYVTGIEDSTFLPGQTRIGFIIRGFENVIPDAENYVVNVIEIR